MIICAPDMTQEIAAQFGGLVVMVNRRPWHVFLLVL
jgi:hypothetical protein